MRTYKDFEDFLQEKFIELNPTILDDDIPDAFNNWLCEELCVDDWIIYGNQYAKVCNPFNLTREEKDPEKHTRGTGRQIGLYEEGSF